MIIFFCFGVGLLPSIIFSILAFRGGHRAGQKSACDWYTETIGADIIRLEKKTQDYYKQTKDARQMYQDALTESGVEFPEPPAPPDKEYYDYMARQLLGMYGNMQQQQLDGQLGGQLGNIWPWMWK